MTETAARAPRRRRTATESLLQIVLVLEACVMFFVTFTVFGLRVLPPLPAFLIGGAMLLAFALVAGLTRYGWGVWLGWVLQAALIATGFLLPAMFIAAALFVALWIACFVKGRQLDARNAALLTDPEPVTDPGPVADPELVEGSTPNTSNNNPQKETE